MGTITFGEQQAKVRSLVKQPTERFILNTEIDGWLNDGASEFALKTLCIEATSLTDAVAGQSEYPSMVEATLLDAVTGTGAGTAYDSSHLLHKTFQSSGTFVATVKIEGSLDNVNWAVLGDLSTSGSSLVINSLYKYVRGDVTARTSGSITIKMIAKDLTSVIKLNKVGFYNSSKLIYEKLIYKDDREMDLLGVRGQSKVRPDYYSLWNDILEIQPAPDADLVAGIKLWFYSESIDCAVDTDVFDIPYKFRLAPVWYALTMAAAKMEEAELAVIFNGKYESLIMSAIQWRATRTKDKYPVVKDEDDFPDY